MAKESSELNQGVPTFEYNPTVDKNKPHLFEYSRSLEDLEGMLVNQYCGETLKMIDVYNNHHVGKPYIKSNYKNVLLKMESECMIKVDPPAIKRRKNKGELTLGDEVLITFSSNKG
jgi:hypothetical protein